MASEIDWAAFNAKLPIAKDEKAQRKEMFEQFDPNSNGYLSLAEVSFLYLSSYLIHRLAKT